MSATHQAVFLDLAGTLVEPVQIEAPRDYRLLPRAEDAVRALNKAGFACPVITVQSRIAKGFFTETQFRGWFEALAASFRGRGVSLGPVYVCPHRFGGGCACAKPRVAMYQLAARDLSLEVSRSFVVGDTLDDLVAAETLGAVGCHVLTGWGRFEEKRARERAAFVGNDVLDVANWIAARTEVAA
jgi:D-glycero-D-manno-heptose 1,7-bisphosphate phosphatase